MQKINSNFFLFNSIKNYDDDYFNFVKKNCFKRICKKKIVFPWKKYSKQFLLKFQFAHQKTQSFPTARF